MHSLQHADLPQVNLLSVHAFQAGFECIDHRLAAQAKAPAHKYIGPWNREELGANNEGLRCL